MKPPAAHLLIALATSLAVFSSSPSAHAHPTGPLIKFPDGGLSVGPAVGFVPGRDGGGSVSVDAALCFGIFAFSATARMLALREDLLFGGGLEASAFVGLNLGVGAGYLVGGERHGVTFHGFVGAPVPLDFLGLDIADKFGRRFKMILLEPYYRLNWFDGTYSHEFGLMLKFTNFSL